jgi:hypothetical protein
MSYSDDEDVYRDEDEEEFTFLKESEDEREESEGEKEEKENEENNFQPARNYREHVGMEDDFSLFIEDEVIGKKTSQGRFMERLIAIYSDINSKDIRGLKLESSDVKKMQSKLDKIERLYKKIEFVNVTAYILGYLSVNGKRVNPETIRLINTELIEKKRIKDETVKQEDVIRYARFWNLHLI